jgi:hypothetical protein
MLPWMRFKLTLVVIGTYCTGSCKSNYHTITTMMAPTWCRKSSLINNKSVKTEHLSTPNTKVLILKETLYSETSLNWTLNKSKFCINWTLNKSKSCINWTLNKSKFCINKTLNKSKSCINWTLNKSKFCINKTLNKSKSCINLNQVPM